MLKITNYNGYYVAEFNSGNLICYTLLDLFKQLQSIYGFALPSLFTFKNLN